MDQLLRRDGSAGQPGGAVRGRRPPHRPRGPAGGAADASRHLAARAVAHCTSLAKPCSPTCRPSRSTRSSIATAGDRTRRSRFATSTLDDELAHPRGGYALDLRERRPGVICAGRADPRLLGARGRRGERERADNRTSADASRPRSRRKSWPRPSGSRSGWDISRRRPSSDPTRCLPRPRRQWIAGSSRRRDQPSPRAFDAGVLGRLRPESILPEERLEVLGDGEHVVFLAGLGADDVAWPDLVLHSLAEDACPTAIDQPVLVAIVIVTIETPARRAPRGRSPAAVTVDHAGRRSPMIRSSRTLITGTSTYLAAPCLLPDPAGALISGTARSRRDPGRSRARVPAGPGSLPSSVSCASEPTGSSGRAPREAGWG